MPSQILASDGKRLGVLVALGEQVVEVDVTRIARLRAQAKAEFERREGVKLTFLPFFALATVEALQQHPAFTMSNPNRLRALAGSFAGTPSAFHRADGRGYDWLAEVIVAADKLNPQTAARFVAPLGRWRKIEPGRAAKMRAALQRILAEPGLSKDVFELASKSLG